MRNNFLGKGRRNSRISARPLASSALLLVIASASIAQNQMVPVPNSFLNTAGTSMTIPANPSEQVQFVVNLNIKDAAGLQAYADAVSNPASPYYRQFLSPDEIGARFGAPQENVDAMVNYLQANGFDVSMVAKNNMLVVAQGTAAQVQSVFQTRIGYVSKVNDDGTLGSIRTNTKALLMPEALANTVASVYGIDTSTQFKRRATTTQLTPPLFRGLYGGNNAYASGYFGQGRNIAIANWDGFKLNNIPLMTAAYSLPVPAGGSGSNIHIRLVGGNAHPDNLKTPGGEGDLDIQNVLMGSPLADIYVYDDTVTSNGASPGTDSGAPLTTLTAISNDNIADIVSESYGWSTYSYSRTTKVGTYSGAAATSWHNMHLSMTIQGMTYMAATGDSGTAEFNQVTTGSTNFTRFAYPDIDPEVLMVGGTVATVDATTGARVSEGTWGLNAGTGGTGGFDPWDTPAHGFAFNVSPSWQTAKLPGQTATYPYRLLPDVSAHAGGGDGVTIYGEIIYYNQGNATYPLGTRVQISGTSCSSPLVAGDLGVVEQRLFSGITPNATRSNVRLGRIQDYLYSHGGNSSIYYDVTTGTNIGNLPNTAIPATAGIGWDFATGWGALNFDGFYHSFLQGKKP